MTFIKELKNQRETVKNALSKTATRFYLCNGVRYALRRASTSGVGQGGTASDYTLYTSPDDGIGIPETIKVNASDWWGAGTTWDFAEAVVRMAIQAQVLGIQPPLHLSGDAGGLDFAFQLNDWLATFAKPSVMGYHWRVETVVGQLVVSAGNAAAFCRFDDTVRAKFCDGRSGSYNEFSGKWNSHYSSLPSPEQVAEALADFQSKLCRILPVKPQLRKGQFIAAEVVQTT